VLDLFRAIDDYREKAGILPSAQEISEMLELGYPFEDLPGREDRDPFYRAEHEVMRASLQVAASRLLGQRTQETRASSDMHDAMRRIEEIRAENRRKMGKPPAKKILDAQRAELAAMMRKGAAKKPKATDG